MGFPADLPGRRHMSQVPVGPNSDPQVAGESRRMRAEFAAPVPQRGLA